MIFSERLIASLLSARFSVSNPLSRTASPSITMMTRVCSSGSFFSSGSSVTSPLRAVEGSSSPSSLGSTFSNKGASSFSSDEAFSESASAADDASCALSSAATVSSSEEFWSSVSKTTSSSLVEREASSSPEVAAAVITFVNAKVALKITASTLAGPTFLFIHYSSTYYL